MRIEAPVRLSPGDALWPHGVARMGPAAPEWLDLFGNIELLSAPALALFCSVRPPGRVIVESFELAASLSAAGGVVVGGFHSPLEREALADLLRGRASVVLCPARSLQEMSLPRPWAAAVRDGRMLLVSAFQRSLRRATASTAEQRNRLAAALACRIMILHASSGGRLARLARECSVWGLPLHCLDHPANEDLRLLGALPVAVNPGPSPWRSTPGAS